MLSRKTFNLQTTIINKSNQNDNKNKRKRAITQQQQTNNNTLLKTESFHKKIIYHFVVNKKINKLAIIK